MQRIINGLLYDTQNAKIIHEDKLTERTLYMTNNGNFFMIFRNGEIVPRTEESAKEYLGERDVEKYIEVWGKPEDA